jgi:hypothetical protein
MRFIVIGKIKNEERYREYVDIGDGVVEKGVVSEKIGKAVSKIRFEYEVDHPIDPFDASLNLADLWPDLTLSFHSEFE